MAKERWKTVNDSTKFWWLYIQRKKKKSQNIPMTNKQSACLAQTRQHSAPEGKISSQSSGQMGSVGVILLRYVLSHSLWFMSSLSGCSTGIEVQPISQTIEANITTLQRGMRVGRVTEDEMAWGGLTPNKSICLHVCPLGWRLALTQLLHDLQADAKQTYWDNWTKNLHVDGFEYCCKMTCRVKECEDVSVVLHES